MAENWLSQVIIDVNKTGFFDYMLPFMIIFAVIYGILEKTRLFGKKAGKINSMLAVIFALIVLPFVSNVNYTNFLSKFVIVIFIFIFLAVIMSFLGFKSNYSKYAAIFALVVLAIITLPEFVDISLSDIPSEVLYIVLIAVVFGIVVWMVSGGKDVHVEEPKPKQISTPKRTEEQAKPQAMPIASDKQIDEELEGIAANIRTLPKEQQDQAMNLVRPEYRDRLKKKL